MATLCDLPVDALALVCRHLTFLEAVRVRSLCSSAKLAFASLYPASHPLRRWHTFWTGCAALETAPNMNSLMRRADAMHALDGVQTSVALPRMATITKTMPNASPFSALVVDVFSLPGRPVHKVVTLHVRAPSKVNFVVFRRQVCDAAVVAQWLVEPRRNWIREDVLNDLAVLAPEFAALAQHMDAFMRMPEDLKTGSLGMPALCAHMCPGYLD